MDCPLHDSLLRVHYKAMLVEDKRVFYDTKVDNDGQPLEFRSGEGLVSCLPFYQRLFYSQLMNSMLMVRADLLERLLCK